MDEKASLSLEKQLAIVSDADSSMKPEYVAHNHMVIAKKGNEENWDDLESDQLLDESIIGNTNNQWWDFWS